MQENGPVRLEPALAGRAAAVLALAFHRDPMYVAVLPEERRRAQVLSWLFCQVVHYAALYGHAYTTPALEGVACWLPPGQTRLTLGRLVRSGLHLTPLKMGLAAYRRFDAYMGYADTLHKRYAPPSHWYLWAIGVEPQSQGRGIGSRLMRPALALADADGTACYLETGLERTVAFYERHGFRVVGQGSVPGQGLPVWAMLREAAGA